MRGERTRLPRLLVAALLASSLAVAQETARAGVRVQAVTGVRLTVGDAARASAFFCDVLQFARESEREASDDDAARLAGVFGARTRTVTVRLGEERVELTEFVAPRGRPFPADTKGNDLWFQHIAIIVSDMDRAYAHLREHRVAHASTGPQTLPAWNQNAGGIRAFYFRGPEGHFLELLQFPPGKGAAKWQRHDALFLGIDHTAITVADTEASLAFYRDTLGMQVVGASENWGPEQERLNGVFGARLRITALRAASGPAVELLEYLAPGPGRPAPHDLAHHDLAHWRVLVQCDDVDAAFAALRRTRARFVSPGPVGAMVPALAVRDPDGHTLELRPAASVAR